MYKVVVFGNAGTVESLHTEDFLIVKKIQPNLIPSNTIPIGCVDLNYKIKFAICHWTWEIGYIWHLQRKSGCFMSIDIW